MSGFLGQIAGSTAGLMTALPALLSELLGTAEGATGGGLPVLIAQFENIGLGDKVRSWLGHGPNQPLEPAHVAQLIPDEKRAAWANEAGVSVAQLDQILAHVLPELVAHAATDGKPAPEKVAGYIDQLGAK